MKIKRGILRDLIESVAYERYIEHCHQALHEGEEGCDIRLRPNQRYKLIEPVRVVPHGEAYFGGEIRGSRGRGTTAATITAGTELLCLRPIGSKQGWFQFDALDKPIRIDINKFCPKTRGIYKSGRGLKVPSMPSKGDVTDRDLEQLFNEPDEGSTEQDVEMSSEDQKTEARKKIAMLRAQINDLLDFLGEE